MGSTYIDLGHARLRLKTTWYVHTHEVSFVEMWYRNDRTLTFMFFFNIIASYLNILFSLRKLLVSYRSITRKTKPLCRESCPQRAFLGDVSATDKKWEEAQPLPRLQASLESRCASRPPKSLRSHQKADGQEAQWIQWDWGSNRCYSWHSWELHWNILESILKFGWHAITKVLFRFLLFSKLIV